MEAWILFVLVLALALSLKFLLSKTKSNKKPPLPPGPSSIIFFLKNIVFQRKSVFEVEQSIIELHKTYGPIVSLRTLTAHPIILVQDRNISHQALLQNGAAFAERPPPKEPFHYLSCDRHDICSSSYGPLWRVLRRNLTNEILLPSRIRLFSPVRKWALRILLNRLRTQAGDNNGRVFVLENFQFMMFCLSTAMCFGDMIDDEKQIREIEKVQYFLIHLVTTFNIFAFFPKFTKVLFRSKWENIVAVKRRQAEIFLPLIKSTKDKKIAATSYPTYVGSLIDLDIPEEGGGTRKLREEDEISNLCHEFISGNIETTATLFEWIMAEIVRSEEIQKKLVEEIETVVPPENEQVKEDDVEKMPYLKAVVMEGLRRHPPGHFLLPHSASDDVELNGYLIPKGSEVLFNNVQLGLDEKVWEDPMEFRPERFLECSDDSGEILDLKGTSEIKIMPFGVGRKMCPAYRLAILHLEYFVANLMREFEWKALDHVDITKKVSFTIVMKNPLRARISPRTKK